MADLGLVGECYISSPVIIELVKHLILPNLILLETPFLSNYDCVGKKLLRLIRSLSCFSLSLTAIFVRIAILCLES